MDKTITRRPTFTPFLIHAARTRGGWRLLLAPFAIVTIFLYGVRAIDRARLKELNHALWLGRRLPMARWGGLANSFAAKTLAGNVLPQAVAQLARDKSDGFSLVLATASYDFYAAEIAHRLGFDDTIGTRCLIGDEGAMLAKIDGENCYGTAKRRAVEKWLAAAGLARRDCHVRFYSDHVSDAPMLEWADEAVAVNAHAPLANLAALRGWAIKDWR